MSRVDWALIVASVAMLLFAVGVFYGNWLNWAGKDLAVNWAIPLAPLAAFAVCFAARAGLGLWRERRQW